MGIGSKGDCKFYEGNLCLFGHCCTPSLQNTIWHIIVLNKYLLNGWMNRL